MIVFGNVGIGMQNPTYQLQLSTDAAAKPGTNTWTIASDERLKTITGKYTKGLKEVLALNPVTYYYKNTSDYQFDPRVLEKENVGLIAQEVAKVFPECVDTTSNGYLGLNNHAIITAFINAFKEQQAMINEQQGKINELQESNDELRMTNNELKLQIENLKMQNELQIQNLKAEIERMQKQLGLEVKAEK